MGAHGRAQVVGGRDKMEVLLAVEGHRPGRPARADVESVLHLVRHLVAAQVNDPDAVIVHHMVENILLAEHLLLVHQDAQHGTAADVAGSRDLEQALIGRLEILELHQTVLNQRRAQQAVGAHQQWPVFRHVPGMLLGPSLLAISFLWPASS